jgi:SAM-dependent methyltransferase
MHPAAYDLMTDFFNRFVPRPAPVLDIGSYDVNGTFRRIFASCPYVGLDIRPGPGVDVVAGDPCRYREIPDHAYTVVISGNAFEHVADDMAVMAEIARILTPGGHACIIAPSAGPRHDYPDDFRRYTPERFAALAESARLTVLENEIHPNSRLWQDCRLIAQKPNGVSP